MAEPQQPLLAAEPWYKSEVQVRAVIAIAAQVVSILFRYVNSWFGTNVSSDDVDRVVADISQIVALFFLGWAAVKRQNASVQPLTLTAARAEARNAAAPPVLSEDPTKAPKGDQ